MALSKKVILIFTLLAFLAISLNTAFFLLSDIDSVRNTQVQGMQAVANKMVNEIEQYVVLMDYALDEMVSNPGFMKALNEIHRQGSDADNITSSLLAQNTMSSVLYNEPIYDNFYRVDVFTRDGFFLSNRFEKNDSVVSLSDESREIAESLDWLNLADENAYKRLLIPSHQDLWTTAREVRVFSAVRAAIWNGNHIGYLEVNTLESELESIFSVAELDGIQVQAIFGNGSILYKNVGDSAVYDSIGQADLTEYRTPDGEKRLVISQQSKWLDLTVYISQESTILNNLVKNLILRSTLVALAILAVSTVLIVLESFRLTHSIHNLTTKVKSLPDSFVWDSINQTISDNMVTSANDAEIYKLEQVFNNLMLRLRLSMENEVTMRECNLHAQLNALQVQINPHFIYNTLNIISAKSMECGNEEVICICNHFAKMLRYSTDLRNKTASLKDEIDHVHQYLALAKIRYEDRLNFKIDIPAELETIILPKLTLQPLVENALTHGNINVAHPISIQIQGTVTETMLHIIVRDNGTGFRKDVLENLRHSITLIEENSNFNTPEVGLNVGLPNTFARLYYHSKGKLQMRLYNDGGAVVELLIPADGAKE